MAQARGVRITCFESGWQHKCGVSKFWRGYRKCVFGRGKRMGFLYGGQAVKQGEEAFGDVRQRGTEAD